MRRSFLICICFLIIAVSAFAENDPMTRLKDETLKYFQPATGRITEVDGAKIIMDIGLNSGIRAGMRLNILSQGEPFIHPVTKEVLGKVELLSGKVELKDVVQEKSEGILITGNAKTGDEVRISGTKVKLMFAQDKNIDWYLADELYRKLKDSGRLEMIDTAIDTGDEAAVLNDAKRLGAEVALMVSSREADRGTLVKERLLWVSDGSVFFETEIRVEVAYSKELKFGEAYFTPDAGEAMLVYNLPFGARLLATGDFDGDGKQEIMLSTGKDVRAYLPSVDLQFLWEIKGKVSDDHLWIDAVDLNRNGRDEVILTMRRNGEVYSAIYELEGTEFRKLWEGKFFLRRAGSSMIAQAHSAADGFTGDLLSFDWQGDYKTGEKIKLPKGMNIYDFAYVEGAEKQNMIFGYDEAGFLNLFDAKGLRLWRSAAATGGFLTKFQKESPVIFLEKGEWSVKDRLIPRNREVLVVNRVPLVEQAKGVGYKSSTIKSYWWNGFSMEENVLADVKGTLLDYGIAGDKMILLTSPFLGIKFGNVLKGENPLVTVLYIYSVKGN
jgi:hypothetical protein